MVVVAGPPGGGKSTLLGRDYFSVRGIPYFNIDERCRDLNRGSSGNIPLPIRRYANQELRQFCGDQFQKQQTFAFETTLRAPFAIEQASLAQAAAFETELRFIAAPAPTHVDRVIARAAIGGHGASERTVRTMYQDSMRNLPIALRSFDHCYLYDSSSDDPVLLVEVEGQQVVTYEGPSPFWMERALIQALGE